MLVSAEMSDFNKGAVEFFKSVLSAAFNGRKTPYAYFFALETIARVPYFSYTSVLHLYETLGLQRRKDLILLHFSESWNEQAHLLVMEELGGGALFQDRFVAQHLAFFYYWLVVILYLAAPSLAYDFNMHVETHARETYNQLLEERGDELRALPVPAAAVEYWGGAGDPLRAAVLALTAKQQQQLLLLQQGGSGERGAAEQTAPRLQSLFDVFAAIRDDEQEHADTMRRLSRDPALQAWGRD